MAAPCAPWHCVREPVRRAVGVRPFNKIVRQHGNRHSIQPESRCNVADRVKGVFGTILRDASSDRPDPILDFIVVSHGVTIRCFRMQWMHYSYEWYEKERNPLNCSVQLIEGRTEGGYLDRRVFQGFGETRRSQQHRREEGHVGLEKPEGELAP